LTKKSNFIGRFLYDFLILVTYFLGNSLVEVRHLRSVVYSVELVLLNKHQI